MRARILWVLIAACLLLGSAALAQTGPTGKITGRVVDDSNAALPGVSISVTSPKLQGTQQRQTSINGSYIFPVLPAGEYRVTFELEGFASRTIAAKISVGQTQNLDVTMTIEAVAETIVVTGEAGVVSETTTSAATYTQDMIENLPLARNIEASVNLAPGVQDSGPAGGAARRRNISISGAQSFESLYLLNGVIINENLRNQASGIFIEDALEETTTSVSGISAEFGRFTGGVVEVVTKSGGNELHGSFRDSFTNESWEETTPVEEEQADEIVETFEATLGGFILKDRLWYFLAGRQFEQSETLVTRRTNISFPNDRKEERFEAKLTFAATPSHSIRLGAFDLTDDIGADDRSGVLEPRAAGSKSEPEDSLFGNYTGVVTGNFLVEAQYSERSLEFVNQDTPDGLAGTQMLTISGGRSDRYHAPVFDAGKRVRESDHTIVKGNYFLASADKGSHDITFGIDTFHDITEENNSQSGNDGFEVWSSDVIIRNQEVFPEVPSGNSWIIHRPLLAASQGSDLQSNAAYVNDHWQLNDHWSFNIGVRYDENDGADADGNAVAKDDNISPRLGVAYDVKGDGDLVLNASAGQYVAKIVGGNVAGSAEAGGNPGFFGWIYGGPSVNADTTVPTNQLVGQDETLQIMFDWFDTVGGTSNRTFLAFAPNIPGVTSEIDGNLTSPNAEEITIGFTKRLGSRGVVRADYVHREFHDFYFDRIDGTTGQVTDSEGQTFDFKRIGNDDDILERVYDGLLTSFSYRLGDRLNLGGNWTWSHARGNFNGEFSGTGPVTSNLGQYPEYRAFEQVNSRRNLGVDVRHKVRAWILYDVLSNERHDLNVSLLQNFTSGGSYSALGAVDPRPFVTDAPDYLTPPSNVNYYFNTDAYQLDDVTSTDFALNYSFRWNLWGKSMEVYVQPEVLNVFNEDAVINVNTGDVDDATTSGDFEAFNPFTETPQRGVHWDLGDQFGEPQTDTDYQRPRTFRFSVGFRF
ncbi:MAG: TonB-dependent receptor [bacterium]|nr:TonB-dependent receptor [bacterium]